MTDFSDASDGLAPDLPSAFGLDPGLEAAGLNVAGLLSRDQYDARVPQAWRTERLLPTAASVYVIGSGGPAFYRAARRARPKSAHPLDEACEVELRRAVGRLREEGFESRAAFYWQRRGRDAGPGGAREPFADFVGLARAAGLGMPSRIGLLLHPRFGPWFAIRALLLTERAYPDPTGLENPGPIDFCAACDAPCRAACPGRAVGATGYDAARCVETRQRLTECASSCAARLACPAGRAHAYDAEALAYHMQAPFRGSPER